MNFTPSEGRKVQVGTFVKKNEKRKMPEPQQKKLESELKECMRCRFFWGNDSRCISKKCCKPKNKKERRIPEECQGCPYYSGNRTKYYSEGDLAATAVTDENGKAVV